MGKTAKMSSPEDYSKAMAVLLPKGWRAIHTGND